MGDDEAEAEWTIAGQVVTEDDRYAECRSSWEHNTSENAKRLLMPGLQD